MPNDNIDRAIKKGTGELGGGQLEELIYEGYGPGGVAIILDVLTDNRNRRGRRAALHLLAPRRQPRRVRMRRLDVQEARRDHGREGARPTRTSLLELALEAGADDVVA